MAAKIARSARGEMVNFDLLAIKQQLAAQPVPVSVNQRRKFIDERDNSRRRTQENFIVSPQDDTNKKHHKKEKEGK